MENHPASSSRGARGASSAVSFLTALCLVFALLIPPGTGRSESASVETLSWQSIGPFGGPVKSIVLSPDFSMDYTLYAAASDGVSEGHGIYKSTDGGATWKPASTGLAAPGSRIVKALAIAPQRTGIYYQMIAATNDGLYESWNEGGSWFQISKDIIAETIAYSPDFFTDRMFFAKDGGGTLYSTDVSSQDVNGALTWKPAAACCGKALAISPHFASDQTIFAGRSVSTDGGETFTELLDPFAGSPGAAFRFAPDYSGEHPYVFFLNTGGDLIRLNTKTNAWSLKGNAAGADDLQVSPMVGGRYDLWAMAPGGLTVSRDDGATWTLRKPAPAWEETAYTAAFTTGFNNTYTMFAGTRSGLYRSNDTGFHFSPSHQGINGLSVSKVRVSDSYETDGTLFAETRLGVLKTTDGGQSWNPLVITGAGSPVTARTLAAVSPSFSSDGTLFAVTAAAAPALMKSTDGGTTWTPCGQPGERLNGAQPDFTTISPQFAADQTLWAGVSQAGMAAQLAKSTSGCATWQEAVEVNPGVVTHDIALSPSFGSDGAALAAVQWDRVTEGSYASYYASVDGGTSWPYHGVDAWCATHSCGPMDGYAAAFSPYYAADRTAFVAMHGGLYYTHTGVEGNDWKVRPVSALCPLTSVAVSPSYQSDDRVWVGSNGCGVFWQRFHDRSGLLQLNDGLGDLNVTGLATSQRELEYTLFAATGSGVWAYSYGAAPTFPAPAPAPLTQEVSAGGGEMISNDTAGSTILTFPAGAVSTSTTVTYASIFPPHQRLMPGGLSGIGHFFSLSAEQGGAPVTQFEQPVTITIYYLPGELGGVIPDSLLLYWWTGSEWSTEGIAVVERGWGMARYTTTHFSDFGVMGETHRQILPLVMRSELHP